MMFMHGGLLVGDNDIGYAVVECPHSGLLKK